MCDITEVNPLPPHYRCGNCNKVEIIKDEEVSTGVDLEEKKCPECGHQYEKDGFDIPFEVFMGFEGDKVPDIDLNFSGEYQNKIHEVTEEYFGRDYVFRAGTISTIASRTAFGFVRNYLDDNEINVKKAEVNRLVDGCTGIKRTTGQHPGGLMVVPKNMDIYDFSPIQHPANDQDTRVRTTHFDYHSISGRILKLDLLGHDDPTSLRMLQDITGVDPETIPLDDPETMKIFSSTESINVSKKDIKSEVGTYGIPEFGTSFVRQMLIETRPSTFAELVRISGLSHGTDVWLNNARELIKDNIANLSEVISVRDDIMNFLLQKGMEPIDAFWIMEHVRKGKGLTDEEESKMRQNNIPDWYIESCKKIKYMFPKAHAAAYVMMAYRIAYFKVHHPKAFYLTYFSTKASSFDAQIVDKGLEFVNDHLNKLNNQDKLTAKDKETITILEVVIEAMHRGIKFGKVDLYNSKMSTFILKDDKLVPPLVCLEGLGTSAAESIIEARKDGDFISVEDLSNRTRLSKTVIEKMKDHGTLKGLPEKNQLSLFTSS
jgi:DNA polymerase-3 subunit alpha (Gram-positive type)